MNSQESTPSQHNQQVLKFLSALSYRSGDLKNYLQEIAIGVSQLLDSDWVVVTICQGDTGQIVASSLDIRDGENSFALHGTLTGVVLRTGKPLIITDARLSQDYGRPPGDYLCYLGMPLRTTHGEFLGTICSFSRHPRQFNDDEVNTVELFAERAATAIDNYRLYQQLQNFNESLEVAVLKRTLELQAAQTRLSESARLAEIGEFAAMIVHEIRNPLTTIKLGLNYFNKADLHPPAQERLSLALSEADRLERLLSEILLYSKPQVLQLAELNINRLMQEFLLTIRELPVAAGRLIQLLPAPQPVYILGDASKLKQVFINLVSNACEAVEPGEVVQWQLDCLPPDRLCIRIHNGGPVIPPEVLPRLTEPFYSTKPHGTGLGLAIVKRIVQQHGGELVIESNQETGTTVRVFLRVILGSRQPLAI